MGFTTRVKAKRARRNRSTLRCSGINTVLFYHGDHRRHFGSLSSEYFLTTNNITQIFVQSSVTVLIGMGNSSLSRSPVSTFRLARFWRFPVW